jgi:hypothetical protein
MPLRDASGLDGASFQVGGRTVPVAKSVSGARIVSLADVFREAFGEQYRKHDSAWQCLACVTPIDRQGLGRSAENALRH